MLKGKLTVVVPYYNDLSGLRRLLETIPVRDVSVIVVDDNSNASEDALLLKDDCPDVRFYKNTSAISNAGSARNLGLSKVNTPYVLFADSDDFFCEGAFERLSGVLDQDFDCAYFLTEAVSSVEDGMPERNVFYNSLIERYSSGDNSIRYEFVVPWSKIVSMKLIRDNNIGFDEVPVSNDMYFSLMVGIYSKVIKVIDKYLYCVVKNGTGISTNMSASKSMCRLKVNMRCNELMIENQVDPRHFFSTKGVLAKSRFVLLSSEGDEVLRKYLRYLISLGCYRFKFKK